MRAWNERQNGQRQDQGRKRFPTCHEYEQRRQQIELRLRRQGPEVGGLERVSASRCRTKSPMDVRHQPSSGDQVFAGDQAPAYARSDRDRNQRCPGGDGNAKKTPRVECPRARTRSPSAASTICRRLTAMTKPEIAKNKSTPTARSGRFSQ